MIMKRGRGKIDPGAAELNRAPETTKIKEIAALPVNERRKLLERAAARAAREYETNKELTVFTDHTSTLNFFEEWR